MNKVLKAAWFATKVGVGGGVVYVTIDQGIWGDSRQAAATYDRLYDIMPGTKKVSEKYLTLPKPDDVNINFRSYWNTGVFYTFDFVANIPTKIVNLKDTVVDFATSPSPAPKSSEEKPKTEEAPAEEKKVEEAAPEENPSPPSPEPSSKPDEKAE